MTDIFEAQRRYVVQAGSRFLRLTGPFAYHDFTTSLSGGDAHVVGSRLPVRGSLRRIAGDD